MPRGGKLSDLGWHYEDFISQAKRNQNNHIRSIASENGFSEDEAAALIEFCEIAFWQRDKSRSFSEIGLDVVTKYNVTEKRFSELFHLALPLPKRKEDITKPE